MHSAAGDQQQTWHGLKQDRVLFLLDERSLEVEKWHLSGIFRPSYYFYFLQDCQQAWANKNLAEVGGAKGGAQFNELRKSTAEKW